MQLNRSVDSFSSQTELKCDAIESYCMVTFRVCVTFGPVVFPALQHRGDPVQVAETSF